ncbi:hypothetical protein [Streptomyces sp. NPDC057682]|uniref:hypothetical protein n=1 Tax=Streptomyces sp. NPDC057682 TaxID=3346210 RepID=UPI0036D129BA
MLTDGTEPPPLYIDAGSGSFVHKTTDWHVYDGTRPRAPKATALRGVCSCGWQSETHHPLDWDQVNRRAPYLYDTTGPESDWARHITDTEARAVPVPEELADLIDQLDERLIQLAADEPLAALRAVARLKHVLDEAGAGAAARALHDSETGRLIGPGLGLPEADARSRLRRYTLIH